jgi:hypothetical protein
MTMTSGDLTALLSELLKIPLPTIDLYGRYLRSASLLSIKGHGRGAAQMTPRDAAVWLTSLCIDHERGGDFVREVKRALNLPLLEALAIPTHFGQGLAFPAARTAGEAIALMIGDTQSLRFADRLAAREDCLIAAFDSAGAFVSLSISPMKVEGDFSHGLWTYQRGERKRRLIERNTTVHGSVLFEIGKALGRPR